MRFFIAAVAAFTAMTIDFETSFKVSDNLQGTRSAFTAAAGAGGDKIQPVEHTIGMADAIGPTEAHDLAVVREVVPQVETSKPTQELPKIGFCEALRQAAESSNIPIAFFARLLWQESRFRFSEVSRAGAQGVAQFMPATAAEVGLDDPFDPYQALPASAKFLRKLHDQFGNLGLAAAAYNAGPGRIQRWLSGRGILPRETRNYVQIITGNAAEDWIEEDTTVSLKSELPREAPCEGVGGLSKVKEVAAIPVVLASSISDTIKKAAVAAQRVAAEKLEAAAKVKTKVVVLRKKKTSRKQLASRRTARKMLALQSGGARTRGSVKAALAKRPVRSRTKAAQRSGRIKAAQRSRQNDET
jgi:hypothetical protein